MDSCEITLKRLFLKPRSKNPHTLDSWVFGYTNSGGNQDNIKIEINYSDRCHVLPIVERHISIELFASKLNALLSRIAIRDIYDIYNMVRFNLFAKDNDKELLRKILVFYIAVGSSCRAEEVSLKFEQLNKIDELTYPQVRDYLVPVLRKTDTFDFQVAKCKVSDFLKEFLVFSDDEYLFIEHFNQRDYRPDILFKDSDIVNRIASHPMALWKCRNK